MISAVFTSQFKSFIFSKDLNIILETVDDINLEELKLFLDSCEKELPSFFQFGSCVQFFFDQKEVVLRGYRLKNSWIASESSRAVHTIPLYSSLDEILTTLSYFYHMTTVV